MKLGILLSIVFAATVCQAGPIKVGNGGDVVLMKDGTMMLADFYIHDVKNPYITSEEPEYGIASRIRGSRWIGFLDINHMMMARKLHEIQKKNYGLGYMLLEALESYRINWSVGPLPLTAAENDLVERLEKEGKKLVRAAARRDDWILFHWETWTRLSDETKVALLIHEAIFTMIRLECNGDRSHCVQDKEKAMRLTADLFKENRPAFELSWIDIPANFIGGPYIAPTLSVYKVTQDSETLLQKLGPTENLAEGAWPAFCAKYLADGPVELKTVVEQPLYNNNRIPFTSDLGAEHALQIVEQPFAWERQSVIADVPTCQKYLRSVRRSWKQKRAESKLFRQRGNYWADFREIVTQD